MEICPMISFNLIKVLKWEGDSQFVWIFKQPFILDASVMTSSFCGLEAAIYESMNLERII